MHGIPGDRVLQDGDLISIDCGAIVDGWHGDAAFTVAGRRRCPRTEPELLRVTEDSMWRGIAAARAGGRLTDIAHAVESCVRAPAAAYGIVEEYGGHGIGTEMHMDPHVPNYGRPGRGPGWWPGMALAVEPMVTLGTADTRVLDDDWTVVTADGSRAAHFEHTVALTDAGPLGPDRARRRAPGASPSSASRLPPRPEGRPAGFPSTAPRCRNIAARPACGPCSRAYGWGGSSRRADRGRRRACHGRNQHRSSTTAPSRRACARLSGAGQLHDTQHRRDSTDER